MDAQIINNTWKQPIPTKLEIIFGQDYKAMQVFKELIYRSCNKDGFFTDEITRKTTPIKRGQTVYGRRKFAQYLGWDDMTCDRNLKKIEKTYRRVSLQRNKNFTIVTIHNYDDLVDMSQQVSQRRASSEPAVSTSKSVKTVKTINTASNLDYLRNIPQEDFVYLSENLQVGEQEIKHKAEELYLYCESKGKSYKNYKAFLRSTLIKGFKPVGSLPAGYKFFKGHHEH